MSFSSEGNTKTDVNYIVAKLENIHGDLAELKKHVDELRHSETGRKAVLRFVIAVTAGLGITVGWLVDNSITLANNIVAKKMNIKENKSKNLLDAKTISQK